MRFCDNKVWMQLRKLLLAVPGSALTLPALADDAAVMQSAVPTTDIGNVVLSLIVIVAAILAIGWFYSRVQGTRGSSGQIMQVLATQVLGPKDRVMLVRIAGKQLVLGVTAMQMQTLLVLDDDYVPAAATLEPHGFAERLKTALKRGA